MIRSKRRATTNAAAALAASSLVENSSSPPSASKGATAAEERESSFDFTGSSAAPDNCFTFSDDSADCLPPLKFPRLLDFPSPADEPLRPPEPGEKKKQENQENQEKLEQTRIHIVHSGSFMKCADLPQSHSAAFPGLSRCSLTFSLFSFYLAHFCGSGRASVPAWNIITPKMASRAELEHFHTGEYLDFLWLLDAQQRKILAEQGENNNDQQGNEFLNNLMELEKQLSPDQKIEDFSSERSFHAIFIRFLSSREIPLDSHKEILQDKELLKEFGFCDDCPPFPGMFTHCRLIAGGTLKICEKIIEDKRENSSLRAPSPPRPAPIFFNFSGGRHHGFSDHAEGFCYTNDISLGILSLLQSREFSHILYIDFDIHHPNGIEKSFESCEEIFTFSLHNGEKTFYPVDSGKSFEPIRGNRLNLPFTAGLQDEQFIAIFSLIFPMIFHTVSPDVVILQCGVDGAANDPIGNWNLTSRAYAWVMRMVKGFCEGKSGQEEPGEAIPLIVLGGGGYDLASTVRCWSVILAVAFDIETVLSKFNKIPEDFEQIQPFAVGAGAFEWHSRQNLVRNQQNQNTNRSLVSLLRCARHVIRQIHWARFLKARGADDQAMDDDEALRAQKLKIAIDWEFEEVSELLRWCGSLGDPEEFALRERVEVCLKRLKIGLLDNNGQRNLAKPPPQETFGFANSLCIFFDYPEAVTDAPRVLKNPQISALYDDEGEKKEEEKVFESTNEAAESCNSSAFPLSSPLEDEEK